MDRFEKVKLILDEAVAGSNFPGHGPFWRGASRDQFVELVIFGRPLLVIGNGAESNLVKGLRGEAPFGLDIGTPGAIFRRMPAGRPPVPDTEIDFINQWIDDGCPADGAPSEAAVVDADAGGPVDLELHVAYWRDFDNWALFQAEPEITQAVNTYFAIGDRWFDFAHDPAAEAAWDASLDQQDVDRAVRLLAERQLQTVRTHYGSPIPLLTLLDSFERFGDDSLPDDPLRPADPRHNMNGPIMWFFWSAFADACLRLSFEPEYWHAHIRCLLLGLMNDGLFRGRFIVSGFSADEQGKEQMRQFVRDLADGELPAELRRRFADTGFGQ